MEEVKIFSPKFIAWLENEKYPVADILADAQFNYLNQLSLRETNGSEFTNGRIRRLAVATARRTIRNWTDIPEEEISDAVYDEDRDKILPELLQAIGIMAQKWLANDQVPPPITAKEISRRTGFSPQRITGIISDFAPMIDGCGQNYRLEPSEDGKKPPIKKAIKLSRYQSRPPGGGPIQRARFQKRRLPAQLTRLHQEQTIIEFLPIDSQPEFPKNDTDWTPNLPKSESVIDPDIADVIRYFKEKGGKKWLRGVGETEFARVLQELSNGREMDVLVWNCFDFDWTATKRPGGYPTCVIKDTVDTSIVNYHSKRVAEILEYLALVGPINPIVLTPTNEAFCQDWNYAQRLSERKKIVDLVTANLSDLISVNITSVPIAVVRFDDYLKSRGVTNNPEDLTKEGIDIFRRKLGGDRKLAQDLVRDNQEYFEQFGIRVEEREVEKFVAAYFGVYAGEGIGFAVTNKGGRKIILIDTEEGRVAKTTVEGVKKAVSDAIGTAFPIISPIPSGEKLNYYRNKRQIIQARKSKI